MPDVFPTPGKADMLIDLRAINDGVSAPPRIPCAKCFKDPRTSERGASR
jgi:hypothetical protein